MGVAQSGGGNAVARQVWSGLNNEHFAEACRLVDMSNQDGVKGLREDGRRHLQQQEATGVTSKNSLPT